MTTDSVRAIAAVAAAFGLAASVPLGRSLCHWPPKRLRVAESFAAGASLAYVLADLMVELTLIGGPYVHATLPLGPTYEKSLFVVVLLGATWWYFVDALAGKLKSARARYRAQAVPQAIYGVFVGGALALEAQLGAAQLALFSLPILLHLTVVESHIHHDFEAQHLGVGPIALALAPGMGAVAWSVLGLPRAALFLILALVAGSTVVQIIQAELPSPNLVRIGPFLLGVCVLLAMIVARWAGV